MIVRIFFQKLIHFLHHMYLEQYYLLVLLSVYYKLMRYLMIFSVDQLIQLLNIYIFDHYQFLNQLNVNQNFHIYQIYLPIFVYV